MSDDLTDDETGQIRELVRLTGISFDELSYYWKEHRGDKARCDYGTF